VKRAILVTTGTVAGMIAAFSYNPAWEQAFSHSGGKHHANAEHVERTAKVSAAKAGAKKHAVQHHVTSKPHPPKKHNGGSSSGGGSTTHTPAASTPSQPSSGGTSGGSTSQPKPKPTHATKPKPTPTPSQPKTYTGSVASTPYGPVQVSITVQNGKVIDAQAVQYPTADPKSVSIAKRALPILRSETLSAQSASISSVSGATYTSKGWMSSLQSALSAAHL
jgi:uncharacterized protein with FMN-binding domain